MVEAPRDYSSAGETSGDECLWNPIQQSSNLHIAMVLNWLFLSLVIFLASADCMFELNPFT